MTLRRTSSISTITSFDLPTPPPKPWAVTSCLRPVADTWSTPMIYRWWAKPSEKALVHRPALQHPVGTRRGLCRWRGRIISVNIHIDRDDQWSHPPLYGANRTSPPQAGRAALPSALPNLERRRVSTAAATMIDADRLLQEGGGILTNRHSACITPYLHALIEAGDTLKLSSVPVGRETMVAGRTLHPAQPGTIPW